MTPERRAARLARRAHGRLFAARAWRRLESAARAGDRAAIEVMIGIVPYHSDSRWAVAARRALVEAVVDMPDLVSELAPTLEPVLQEICSAAGGEHFERLWRIADSADTPLFHALTDDPRAWSWILDSADPTLVDTICRYALRRPELASRCAESGLSPADPVDRAVYFLVTGRLTDYRAVDSDGSLLSEGYATAPVELRRAIQAAMPDVGDLDLVGVLAGGDRRDRIGVLDDQEVDYLADRLADRGDAPGLWALALDLPLAAAIRVLRRLKDWEPDDNEGRALCRLLSAIDPGIVERAIAGFDLPDLAWQARIQFGGRVNDVAFAPDAPMIAVAGTRRIAAIIDLGNGSLHHRFPVFNGSVGSVLHLGADVVIAAERTNTTSRPCRIIRCTGTEREVLCEVTGSVTALAATAGGGFAAATRAGDIIICDPDGHVRRIPVSNLRLNPELEWPRSIVADPESDRLAVLTRRKVVIIDRSGAVILTSTVGGETATWSHGAFTEQERLVVASSYGSLATLDHGRNPAALVATRLLLAGVAGLAPSAHRGRLTILDQTGELRLLDPETLDTGAPSRHGENEQKATGLRISPGGRLMAVSFDSGSTDLYDLRPGTFAELVGRPVSCMVPADLATIAAVGEISGMPEDVQFVAGLLRACLEYRFRFDIEPTGTPGATAVLASARYAIDLQDVPPGEADWDDAGLGDDRSADS